MFLAHHSLGGSGPVLLILHANSLHSHCYLPMVQQVLGSHYTCIALDLPGHGASPALAEGADVVTEFTAAVYHTVQHLGLLGCRVFAHSLGGTIAANVESCNPGTFQAIYMFEPPLMTARNRHTLLKREVQQGIPTAGLALSAMARKRRAQWSSQKDACTSLGSKLPFSAWHPHALHIYVQCGTRPVQADKQVTADVSFSCSSDDMQHAQQGCACQYQPLLDEPVQLVCTPRTEERVFLAMEPPVGVEATHVRCPLVWAVTGTTTGPHSRLPALGRASVQEFQQGALHEFSHLSHFGPLEAPTAVAEDVLSAFKSISAGKLSAAVLRCHPEGVSRTGVEPARSKM